MQFPIAPLQVLVRFGVGEITVGLPKIISIL